MQRQKEIDNISRNILIHCIQGCKNFSSPVTIKEAIDAVGADYQVEKEHLIRIPDSLYHSIMEGMPSVGTTLTRDMIIQSHMATVRTDRNLTLGVVGSKYGVVQNSKAFEFIDLLASGVEGYDKAVIETAGILGDGERMYVTAKLPSDIFLNDNGYDPINRCSDCTLYPHPCYLSEHA